MSEIKIEFAVQMSGEKCSEKVKKSLEGVGEISVNLKEGRVVVTTKHPWSEIQDRIEKTGRTAVLCGFGGKSAVAMINNNSGSESLKAKVQGVVRFSAISNDETGCVVDGVIDGLTPGLHGMHLHECGDISAGYESLGGHYNPRGSPHGSPEHTADKRHVGDLGNIRADEAGRATFRFIDPLVEVWDIIGRSVVVTQNPDDYGQGKNERSLVDGNSGDRIACGIIARSAGILQNYKKICACDGVTLWDERNKPLAGGNRSANGKL